MTLLFNGSFKSTNKLTAPNVFQSSGVYETDTSAPQMDSITIIPAPRRPGKYVARFYNGIGPEYNSRSDQHNLIYHYLHEIPTTYREIWYSISMLFDKWTPSGQWSIAGLTINHAAFNSQPAPWGNNRGLNLQPETLTNNMTLLNNKLFFNIPAMSPFALNIWYDVMFHIKYGASPDGFLEMYLRKEGELLYTKVFEKFGYETLFPEFETYPNNFLNFNVGIYRSSASNNEQSFLAFEPKAGTTRADVEYKTSNCPSPNCDFIITQI